RGETMKLRVLLLVLLAVVASVTWSSASVTTLGGTVYAGWNQIALHGVPIDPAPSSVFSGITVDGTLYRWEGTLQSTLMYDMWQPDKFGNLLLNEGYWLLSDAELPYSYQGLNDTDSMDIWISLPKAGWAKVTDGNVTVSMQVASKVNNWLNSTAYWWDAQLQSGRDLGIPEDWPTSLNMRPKHGYWVNTNVDKLALILESEYAIPIP
ncbi:MAG: hypothetical protein NTU88_09185, partial [Armatimonadetes bacterium]|nr:hypothetical protein [Armatimonadota bacterium]